MASAVIGAVIGSGAGRGPGAAVKEQKTPKLARGGVGPPTAGGKLVQWKGPVPILMYHVIDNAPPGAQLPELYVGPTTFDQQMKALDKEGYTGVSLNQVYDAWFKGGEAAPRNRWSSRSTTAIGASTSMRDPSCASWAGRASST